ncbi:hypothetical protein LWI28_021526 [Acer negundo]|uniref:Glycosyltransferase n=1 Tax=Acer negundo TaxID=4023 RepID=A0AAD5JGW3_ACENE|nr:hypothetical protein LWI28_021526 [Acer negundo]
MASNTDQLHFVLIPLLCPGHLLPMVDIARLLAQHGVKITLIVTPLNAILFDKIINRDIESGLSIQLLQIPFPCVEAGLPEGYEDLSALPSRSLAINFFDALRMMQQPMEKFVEETHPRPSCIISDRHLPWTIDITSKFGIPRLAFDGTSCFSFMCSHNISISKVHENVTSDSDYFVVPNLPDKIELTKAQVPSILNPDRITEKGFYEEMKAADMASYGLVINSFEELESRYVEECKKVKGDKVWCIGPVSLRNKENIDKSQRCNKTSSNIDDQNQYLKWLDSWPSKSVIYACLGTLSCLTPLQLMELGLGLEASNRPFIWVIREDQKSSELEKFIREEEGFEERTKNRGLVIQDWAPQVLILSHPAIGGFLTHCGWNSTLEGVCAGVPMITWPLLAEQFYNEQVIVKVLRIGETVGANVATKWGEEDKYGVKVKSETIRKAIDLVMDEEEGEEKRKRTRELADLANKALEEGGSSYCNIRLLIKDIMQQVMDKKAMA